jgi:hypothetical protein
MLNPSQHGAVLANVDGTYTYLPNANITGTDSFSISISDGTATATGSVTLLVEAVIDTPVATDSSVSIPRRHGARHRPPVVRERRGQSRADPGHRRRSGSWQPDRAFAPLEQGSTRYILSLICLVQGPVNHGHPNESAPVSPVGS